MHCFFPGVFVCIDMYFRCSCDLQVSFIGYMYLAVSLRGQAQAILGDLPHEDQSSYDILVNALEERFASPSLTEL
jgi:hypothetical protein